MGFRLFCEQFDLIALYETWQTVHGEFDAILPGYINFDCMRPGNNGRGSGGVTVFIKDSTIRADHIKRIYNEWTDCIILFVSRALTDMQTDLVLVFTYVSPGRSVIYANSANNCNGIETLNNKLTSILSDLPDSSFFVAGDLNARTKDLEDYIPCDDIDLIFNGETAYPGDTFCLPRNNKDSVLNRFGSSLIELCCMHNLHMFNGRLFGDKGGNFTCTANDGHSVVDYCLGSTSLFSYVMDFYVGTDDFSDHFPLCCKLTFDNCSAQNVNVDHNQNLTCATVYKWKDVCKDNFVQHFSQLFDAFSASLTETNIVTKLQEFNNLFKQAGESMKKRQSNQLPRSNIQPELWDNECEQPKSVKYKSLRKFRTTNCQTDFELYLSKKRVFKNMCSAKKRLLERRRRDELVRCRTDAKAFWQKLKTCKNTTASSDRSSNECIGSDTWVTYFTGLLYRNGDETYAQPRFNDLSRGANCDELNKPITQDEIRQSIRSLNRIVPLVLMESVSRCTNTPWTLLYRI